jgi:hypothetical protein
MLAKSNSGRRHLPPAQLREADIGATVVADAGLRFGLAVPDQDYAGVHRG